MRRFSNKILSLAFLSTLFEIACSVAFAQQDHAGFTVGGRVPPMLSLSVPRVSSEARVTVESDRRDFAQIVIEGGKQAGGPALAIPLEIRTNVAYEVRYSLLETEGCAPAIRVSVESVRASGAWVLPRATEGVKRQQAAIMRRNSPALLLTGPRVSAKGASTSASNALQVVVRFDGDQSKARGCGWKARVQLSLHPSEIDRAGSQSAVIGRTAF